MHRLRVWTLVGLVILCVSLGGCGGGGTHLENQQTTTTLGQELKDLEDAYQKGIITKEEYEKSKKSIIKKRTK